MSIRQRMYPSAEAEGVQIKHCADARTVWNAALEQLNWWRPGVRSPRYVEQAAQLAEARRALPWLAEGSSSVQQQALRDFEQACRNWWAGTHRRPKWRRKGFHEGFYVRDLRLRRLNRKWGEVLIPKAGWVKFRVTRPWQQITAATSGRVTLDRSRRWHISFVCPPPEFERERTGAAVGVDLGVVATITTSDGQQARVPGLTAGETQRLRRLERRNARQQKGSNRRERTKGSIARLHARGADRRKDWVEQTSTRLVREHDLIVLEDLRVRDMVRSARGTIEQPGVNVRAKAGLNRSIGQQAWSLLRRRIEDKAATCGVVVVAVHPANTSQTCHKCKHADRRSRKSQAVFRCVTCGHEANADTNAANNVLAAGLAVTARGGTARSNGSAEARTTLPEAA